MGRPRKNVLNQKSKKAKVEPKEEVIEEIPIEEQDGSKPKGESFFEKEEPKEVVEAKIIIAGNELATKLSKEEEPKIEFTNDPIEIEIPEKPLTRTLTAKEIRRFQRTGIMPK